MFNHSLIHPRTSKFAQEAQIKKFPDFDKKNINLNKSMNFQIIDPKLLSRMRKYHNKSFNKINSSMSVIRSNKISRPGSKSNLNQDEDIDTDNILGRIGEEEDQSSGSKAFSSKLKNDGDQQNVSLGQVLGSEGLDSHKNGREIKMQSRQSSSSSIKQVNESDSFVSSEYSEDELKDNKREFLASRLLIDEKQLDLRTEEKSSDSNEAQAKKNTSILDVLKINSVRCSWLIFRRRRHAIANKEVGFLREKSLL